MNEGLVCRVTQEHAQTRLDQYVSQMQEITRSAAQSWIESGAVCVGGEKKPKNYKVRQGDVVQITPPPLLPSDVVPENIPLEILYEDNALLVVNKPKGMVVHPAPGHADGTLVNALLHHCKGSLSGINGVLRPGIVHRIDRDTSGLLVVAKEDAAHVSLAEQIASHSFARHYEALVHGTPREPSGTVQKPIGRHPVDRKKMAITQDGRAATTHYRTLTAYRGFSHLQLQLETGRTHQIRVHMASIGHPVVGDPIYGRTNHPFDTRNASLLQGQCLHAKTISFLHPHTGALMEFDSALPDYFVKILEKLKELAQ